MTFSYFTYKPESATRKGCHNKTFVCDQFCTHVCVFVMSRGDGSVASSTTVIIY